MNSRSLVILFAGIAIFILALLSLHIFSSSSSSSSSAAAIIEEPTKPASPPGGDASSSLLRTKRSSSSSSSSMSVSGGEACPLDQIHHLLAPARPASALNDVRSPISLGGKAVSFVDDIFPDLDSLCSSPPGFVSCGVVKKATNNGTSRRISSRRVIVKKASPLAESSSTGARSRALLRRRSSNSSSSSTSSSTSSISHSPLQDFPTVADLVSSTPQRCVAAGCCCSWTPVASSCRSGIFNRNNTAMLRRLSRSHFVSTPTSPFRPTVELASRACPVFDRGSWALPDNFLDLDLDGAAAAAVRAGGRGTSSQQQQQQFAAEVEQEKLRRRNIGPLLVWKLAREIRALKSVRVNDKDVPGMLVLSGDSMVRQLSARMIHAIRSRECSDTNEMFRGGVFERYFHISSGYVVTTRGDALLLGLEGCERVAASPAEFTLPGGGGGGEPGRVLLRVCYVWDNTVDASREQEGTEFVLDRIAEFEKQKQVAAIYFMPHIHHCNYVGGACLNANQSNAMTFRVFAAALRHSVPRMVTSTSIERHWYPFFAADTIRERNQQLRNFFAHNMWPSVAPRLDDAILAWWRRRRLRKEQQQQQHPVVEPEPLETRALYRAMGPHGGPGTRLRLYDFALRHSTLAPRQIDNGHSMCMFFPLRESAQQRRMVDGLNGVSPNGARCEDPWNFLFVTELMALLFA